MNTSADETAGGELVPPPTVEERVLLWLHIVAQVVAVLWAIDIATKGQASEQIKYRWRRHRARHNDERRFRIAANHALWQARRIVESEQ